MMKYYLYKGLFALLGRLPWTMLRGVSRALAFLLERVVRYRYVVVKSNLSRSFPSYTPAEIERTISEFYYYLVFQFLSSPKLLSLSAEQIKREHLLVEGIEIFGELKAQGHPITIILMGHYGNWELFSAGQIYFNDFGIQQDQLYRPLKDEAIDRVQREMRSAFGSDCTPKADIGRKLIGLMRGESQEGRTFAFIADQTPGRDGKVGLWVHFLNQPTAFLDGAERLARKFRLPVVYMDVERLADTRYIGRMKLLSREPHTLAEHELTRMYVAELERTISRAPAYWLWSHRRWKHTPPADVAQTIVNAERHGEG